AAGTTTIIVKKVNQSHWQEAQAFYDSAMKNYMARETEYQLAAHAGTTQMRLTGTSGAIVTGFFVQNGQRIAVSNSLPWSVVGTNISQFKFQTFNPEDRITIALVYDGNGAHASRTETLDVKFPWIQGKIENGLITMKPSN